MAAIKDSLIVQSIPLTFCGQKATKRFVEKKAIFALQNHG